MLTARCSPCALIVGLTVALLFTIAPSLYSVKRGISPLLSQSGRHTTGVRRQTGAILVMVQLSLSVVILSRAFCSPERSTGCSRWTWGSIPNTASR